MKICTPNYFILGNHFRNKTQIGDMAQVVECLPWVQFLVCKEKKEVYKPLLNV
jgi:hypothetical protein